jgi:hypothetical protein
LEKPGSLADQSGRRRRARAGKHRNREHARAEEAEREDVGANLASQTAQRFRRLGWRGDAHVMRAPERRDSRGDDCEHHDVRERHAGEHVKAAHQLL